MPYNPVNRNHYLNHEQNIKIRDASLAKMKNLSFTWLIVVILTHHDNDYLNIKEVCN